MQRQGAPLRSPDVQTAHFTAPAKRSLGPLVLTGTERCRHQPQVPPLVLLHDGTGHVPPGLREIGANIRSRGVYAMDLPAEAARMKNGAIATTPYFDLWADGACVLTNAGAFLLRLPEWQADKHGSLENLADLYCQALATEFGEEGQFVLLGKAAARSAHLPLRTHHPYPSMPVHQPMSSPSWRAAQQGLDT